MFHGNEAIVLMGIYKESHDELQNYLPTSVIDGYRHTGDS